MTEKCSCGGEEVVYVYHHDFLDDHPLLLKLVGLISLLVAVWFLYDGWLVLGAFGLALLTGHLNGVPDALKNAALRILGQTRTRRRANDEATPSQP